jgi:signal transduction histidine kinase
MHRAIRRVAAGDLGAQAEVGQPGEIGELAAGLNNMVAQLDDLHRSLNLRVEAATEELRQRNTRLMRSYESVLDLRETAARAQQLAAVGQTMANVAHQIGTPLNLVSGHVQLLRQELIDPAVQRRLAVVQEQVERVAAVVRELLERARPETERKPVAVGTLLARLADAMRPRLSKADVALNLDVEPSLPDVLADETQLELALLNIVTNALDAMPHGGELTLDAKAADTGLRIEIRDTGSGIAPELLAKIFEPWVTTKATGRGTGLGLSITRDVVAGLGGAITVRSEPDQGAAFIIELPGAPKAALESRG